MKKLTALFLALVLCLSLIVPAFADVTNYAITNGTPKSAKETNHGYIAIDKATATEGDTVTITVNPAEGYQLKSLTATPVAPTEYTVTFDLNGITGTAPTAQTIEKDGKVTKPADPTAQGYKFLGWYKEAECTNEWKFETDTVTKDTTLYAKWAETKTFAKLMAGQDFPIGEESGWVNENNYKMYLSGQINLGGKLMVKGPAYDVQAVFSGNVVTKVENGWEYVWDGDNSYTVTFNMDGDKLVSITYTPPASLNDTIENNVRGTYTAPAASTKYTVTFDLNDITGTAPTSQTIKDGEKVTKPADPTDTVHTFAGWYKTKDATTGALSDPWDFDNGTVTANMTLYAQWTRTLESIYTGSDIPKVTGNTAPDNAWENGDGGKAFIAYSGKTTEVLYLYKTLEPSGANQLSCRKTEDFTKIGDDYVLDYYVSSNFYGKYTLHMTEGKFTSVTFDGAADTVYENLSGTYSAPVTTPLNSPAPKLLKSPAPVDPETITPAEQTDGTYQFTMPAKAVTVTAEFAPITYTVTYNANGYGTAPAATTTDVTRGWKITAPATPTDTGYTFGGWFKEEGCTNAWDFDNDKVATDTTLYAKWTANSYDITYKDQGDVDFSGTHESGYPEKHTYGAVTNLKKATKSGYTFDGWYAYSDYTGGPITSLGAEDYTTAITLYAKWTKNSSGRSGGAVTTVVNMPLIRTGNRGDAVKELQTKLNALGYNCGSVDGIFGSKTYAAVVAFQKAMGIGVDGIVGPETWGKLGVTGIIVTTAPAAANSAVSLTISSNMPLITKGSTGDAVKALQAKLNALGYDCGKVDGIFGDKTLAAVKAYQTDKALLVDGKVGNQTWGALR